VIARRSGALAQFLNVFVAAGGAAAPVAAGGDKARFSSRRCVLFDLRCAFAQGKKEPEKKKEAEKPKEEEPEQAMSFDLFD
jgi:hypothetical protein